MSMMGNLLRVSPSELEEYKKDSSLLESRIDSDENMKDENYLDIDRSWDGIFGILMDSDVGGYKDAKPPFGWLFCERQAVDNDQDMGYGPAVYSTPEQVVELNNALNTISVTDFQKKFESGTMTNIGFPPETWKDKDILEFWMEYFEKMKEFYSNAAKAGQAMITFIS